MTRLFTTIIVAGLLLFTTLAVMGQVEAPQSDTASGGANPVAIPGANLGAAGGASSVVVVNPPPPKTRLQAMAEAKGALIVCGYTDVGTVQRGDGGYVRVTAAEFTNTTTSTKAYGLLVFIHQTDDGTRETRSYLDEDELDNLFSSLDSMSKLDHTTTQLNDFDAKIRTRGDLEIANINDGGVRELALHGVEIIATSGQELWAATRFPLARMAEFQQYLTAGKQLIDKAKENKPAAP